MNQTSEEVIFLDHGRNAEIPLSYVILKARCTKCDYVQYINFFSDKPFLTLKCQKCKEGLLFPVKFSIYYDKIQTKFRVLNEEEFKKIGKKT